MGIGWMLPSPTSEHSAMLGARAHGVLDQQVCVHVHPPDDIGIILRPDSCACALQSLCPCRVCVHVHLSR
jgi:hypothetical protein